MAAKGLSGYAVERAARGKITQSYVNRIKNGEVKAPSLIKLKALAKGLGVPEPEMLAEVRGGEADQTEIAHERLRSIDRAYKGMSNKKKALADMFIEMFEREIIRISEEAD